MTLSLAQVLDPIEGYGLVFEPRPVMLALVDMVVMLYYDKHKNEIEAKDMCLSCDCMPESATCATCLADTNPRADWIANDDLGYELYGALTAMFAWAVRRGHCTVAAVNPQFDSEYTRRWLLGEQDMGSPLYGWDKAQTWLINLARERNETLEALVEHRPPSWVTPAVDLHPHHIDDRQYSSILAGMSVVGNFRMSPLTVAMAAVDWCVSQYAVDGAVPCRSVEDCTASLESRVIGLANDLKSALTWLVARRHCILSAPMIMQNGMTPLFQAAGAMFAYGEKGKQE